MARALVGYVGRFTPGEAEAAARVASLTRQVRELQAERRTDSVDKDGLLHLLGKVGVDHETINRHIWEWRLQEGIEKKAAIIELSRYAGEQASQQLVDAPL